MSYLSPFFIVNIIFLCYYSSWCFYCISITIVVITLTWVDDFWNGNKVLFPRWNQKIQVGIELSEGPRFEANARKCKHIPTWHGKSRIQRKALPRHPSWIVTLGFRLPIKFSIFIRWFRDLFVNKWYLTCWKHL
jgi:hypothetical protein